MLPHVDDAIMLFDSAWRMMTRSEVIKCWVRSECLGSTHVSQNKSLLYQMKNNSDLDIDLVNTSIDDSDSNEAVTTKPLARRIHETITDYRTYSQECNTPLHEILAKVEDIVQEADLINAFNSPAPFDDVRTKDFVTVTDMMNMYENETSNEEIDLVEPLNTSQNSVNPLPTLNSLSQVASEALKVTQGQELLNELRIIEEHVAALKSPSNMVNTVLIE